jgi:hypothetical protein
MCCLYFSLWYENEGAFNFLIGKQKLYNRNGQSDDEVEISKADKSVMELFDKYSFQQFVENYEECKSRFT